MSNMYPPSNENVFKILQTNKLSILIDQKLRSTRAINTYRTRDRKYMPNTKKSSVGNTAAINGGI
jgi:hypothetical protein